MSPGHPRASLLARAGARARVASIVALFGLSFVARPARALEPPDQPGRAKITAGAALMIGGAVVTGLGAGLYVANENAAHTSCAACAETSWVFPTVLMALGGAMFVSGVPVFVIGQVERSRSATNPTATLFIGPFGASARVTF